jgi:hypothetical protein
MHITPEMLRAATQKAIELGILPRRSQMEDLATNMELMQEILKAALEKSADKEKHD